MDQDNNYVVGRGKLYFDRFLSGSKTKTGERYFGNTPEFTNSQDIDTLDHYNSDEGLKVKDASVDLQVDASFNFTTDNVSAENLALWWQGDHQLIAVEAAVGNTMDIIATPGLYYQLGETPELPFGVGNVDNVVLTKSAVAAGTVTIAVGNAADNDTVTIDGHTITFKTAAPTGQQVLIGASASTAAAALAAYVNTNTDDLDGITAEAAAGVVTLTAGVPGTAGNALTLAKSGTNLTVSGATFTGGSEFGETVDAEDNWEVDLGTGRVQVLHDATDILPGDAVRITFDNDETTLDMVIAKGKSVYGALRFLSRNPVGKQKDYFWPYVKLTPDGDYALKGDDWQTMSFSGEVLKLNDRTERVYIRARD